MTLDPAALRRRMVERQIAARGVDDPRLLEALRTIPREAFVPPERQDEAYADCALPIEAGQTISQPYTVAFMIDALRLTGVERVLEIGAGSGYGAAVLGALAAEVHTVERLERLAESARRRLAALGCRNVRVHHGDGSLGLPELAPFDAICVTAAAPALPPALVAQLADGGRLVAPIGDLGGQRLLRVVRHGAELRTDDLGGFAFVPLIGRQGWRADETS